jgi:hypothetical protein
MHAPTQSVIQYPRLDQTPAEAFGPRMLALTTAQIFSWRQGPGDFGGVHLHACWGESSALTRRYHGSSTFQISFILRGVRALARANSGPHWPHLADTLAAQLLWQQAPDGGFFHASAEFEPTYKSSSSCPIHQMLPVLALLDYYAERPSGLPIRSEIETALERQLAWFAKFWWKRGNGRRQPLDFAGWCGVTNQDLVAICALARYGETMGDWRPFEEYGLPALETYLSPRYYHEKIGLFERGDFDKGRFTERCSYMCLCADLLNRIQGIRPHPRIPAILARIAETLAAAVYVDEQGGYQVGGGLDDEEFARSGRMIWTRGKIQVSGYPEMIETLERYGVATPELREKIEGLERTLASYVFADGTVPTSLDLEAPLFAVMCASSSLVGFWTFLIRRNKAKLDWEKLPAVPAIDRRCGNLRLTTFGDGWVLREGDKIQFRGVKMIPHGITQGDEQMPNYPLEEPAPPDFVEEIVLPTPGA